MINRPESTPTDPGRLIYKKKSGKNKIETDKKMQLGRPRSTRLLKKL